MLYKIFLSQALPLSIELLNIRVHLEGVFIMMKYKWHVSGYIKLFSGFWLKIFIVKYKYDSFCFSKQNISHYLKFCYVISKGAVNQQHQYNLLYMILITTGWLSSKFGILSRCDSKSQVLCKHTCPSSLSTLPQRVLNGLIV